MSPVNQTFQSGNGSLLEIMFTVPLSEFRKTTLSELPEEHKCNVEYKS